MYFIAPTKTYKNFAKRVLPIVGNTPNEGIIWRELLKAAGINPFPRTTSERDLWWFAKHSFSGGPFPEIRVENFANKFPDDVALFSPTNSLKHLILVNEKFMKIYESDSPNPKADEYMAMTLRHEFVHYLDFNCDGKSQDPGIEAGESATEDDHGDIFEKSINNGRKFQFWR